MKTLKKILSDNNWSGENCDIYTDKDSTHNFIDGFYESEFAKYKDKSVKILEVGIASGVSLLLWNEYFLNNTGVYGIDINPRSVTREIDKHKNIKTIFTDGYKEEFVNILPNFDIIIDDGPHTLESMISFIKLYLPKLNANGVLVIEDIQSIDWMPILSDAFKTASQDGDEYDVIDLRETKGRYDDLLFVVRRKK
jgi:hypothetical protein